MSIEFLPTPLNQLDSKDVKKLALISGETLFVQNSITTGCYFLQQGTVVLHRTTSNGHTISIHTAKPEETFAEASIFSERYHCTATATCSSLVLECRKSAILSLLEKDPAFSQRMMVRLSEQLQTSRRQVELLSIRNAGDRILAAMKDGLLIDDINAFSDTIGLARETVYRTLAQLTQSGLTVKTGRGKYYLKNSVEIDGLNPDQKQHSKEFRG